MSNLGSYQTMTTLAKRFGGPIGLGAVVFVAGYVGGKLIEISLRPLVREMRTRKSINQLGKLVDVTKAGADGSGLSFDQGDVYRVVQADTDMVLIEKIGDTHNPYMVSPDFLRSVSNYS